MVPKENKIHAYIGEIKSTDATRYEFGPSYKLPSIPMFFSIGLTKYKVDDPVIANTVHIMKPSL